MSRKDEARYIQFPICLMPVIKNDLNKIFNYGIVKYSFKMQMNFDESMELIYEMHSKGNLSSEMNQVCFDAVYYGDRKGYNGDVVPKDQSDTIQRLTNYFISQYNYNDHYDNFLEYAKIHGALKALNLTNNGEYKRIIVDYNDIDRKEKAFNFRHGIDATVSISTEMIFNYLNHDKTHYEWELLKMYLAIKSIQGTKDYACTHKKNIVERMLGAKSETVLIGFMSDRALKRDTASNKKKFEGRYFFDQALHTLCTDFDGAGKWLQACLPHNRAYYISTKMDMHKLMDAIVTINKQKQTKRNISDFKEQQRQLKIEINKALKYS